MYTPTNSFLDPYSYDTYSQASPIFSNWSDPQINKVFGGDFFGQDAMTERAKTDLMEILGPDFGRQTQTQTPIGSGGLLGAPYGQTYQGGGVFHNAMRDAIGGNQTQLTGLLAPGTSIPTYTGSGSRS